MFLVVFFKAWDELMRCSLRNPELHNYVRNARVLETSPSADHFAIVIGRHNGARNGNVPFSKEDVAKILPMQMLFIANGIVTISGEDLNVVACHKAALIEDEVYMEAALSHMRNLPPIFTGDLGPLVKDIIRSHPAYHQ